MKLVVELPTPSILSSMDLAAHTYERKQQQLKRGSGVKRKKANMRATNRQDLGTIRRLRDDTPPVEATQPGPVGSTGNAMQQVAD